MNALKILIIGIDGASHTFVEKALEAGYLPFLDRVRREGRFGKLRSVVPALSPPAWSSFLTGLHPGRHGILHFLESDTRDPDAPETLVTSRSIRGRTFLDGLARAGFRVSSISVPATYPPWDVKGVMVSGYPCPEERWSVWPPDTEIRTPPSSQVATVAGTEEDGPRDEAVSALWRRRDLVHEIVSKRSPDCLLAVFSAVDHVQHLYGWEGNGGRILSVYREADRLLEDLSGLAGPETLLMVVSDHGGGPPAGLAFRTKRWLAECGLAEIAEEAAPVPYSADHASAEPGPAPEWVMKDPRFRNRIAAGAADEARRTAGSPVHLDTRGVDVRRSRVLRFRLCDLTEGLVVNVAGRQRHGTVRPEDLSNVKDEAVRAARALCNSDSHAGVLKDVRTREEVFPGAAPNAALPDVVLFLERGVKAVGETRGPMLETLNASAPSARGTHSADGIWALAGPGVVPGGSFEASITDVAPTVLARFGARAAEVPDGRVRVDLLRRNAN